MRYHFFCWLMTGALAAGVSAARAQERLTLAEALAVGLEKNFNVRLAELRYDSLQNNLTLGNAGLLPTLDATAGQTNTIEDVALTFVDGGGIDRENAESRVRRLSAEASWTFEFGAVVAYQLYETLALLGRQSQQQAAENTVADVSDAYYDVVQLGAKVRAFERTLETSQFRVDIAQAKYEVGTAPKTELLTARLDYNTDRAELLRQQQLLREAKTTLNELLARPPDYAFTVADTAVPLRDSLRYSELQGAAERANTNLRLARTRQEITRTREQQVRSGRLPSVALFGSYNRVNLVSEAGFLAENQTTGFTFGATARLNLFDGFNQYRREQNAQVARLLADTQYEQLEVALAAALRRTYTEYVNSLALIRLETESFELARQGVSIAQDRYQTGVSTFLEFREVQRNAIGAEIRLIDAQYRAKLLETELRRLGGYLRGV